MSTILKIVFVPFHEMHHPISTVLILHILCELALASKRQNVLEAVDYIFKGVFTLNESEVNFLNTFTFGISDQ